MGFRDFFRKIGPLDLVGIGVNVDVLTFCENYVYGKILFLWKFGKERIVQKCVVFKFGTIYVITK